MKQKHTVDSLRQEIVDVAMIHYGPRTTHLAIRHLDKVWNKKNTWRDAYKILEAQAGYSRSHNTAFRMFNALLVLMDRHKVWGKQ